jgi:hypothetical protein
MTSCKKGDDSEAVSVVTEKNVEGNRERGRPKEMWLNKIENHMETAGVNKREVEDKVLCKYIVQWRPTLCS